MTFSNFGKRGRLSGRLSSLVKFGMATLLFGLMFGIGSNSLFAVGVNLGPDQSICEGEEITLEANVSSSACLDCCTREISNTSHCTSDIYYGIYLGGKPYEVTNTSWEECSDGTVHFTASGSNAETGDYLYADIYLLGGTMTPPTDSPKENNCGTTDATGWMYYTSTTGTITSQDHGIYEVTNTGPVFQVGNGANVTALGFGGSGWFDVSGGDGFYTHGDFNFMLGDLNCPAQQEEPEYSWSTGATGPSITVTQPGTYSLTVTDCDGSMLTDEVIVTEGAEITAGSDIEICAGAEATLTAEILAESDCPTCCTREVFDTEHCVNDYFYGFYLVGPDVAADDRRYNIVNATWTECEDGSGTYTATVQNATDVITIDVVMANGTTTVPEGSPKENICELPVLNTWVYYSSFTGTMTSQNHGVYNMIPKGPSLQVGMGANATGLGMGASSWFDLTNGPGADGYYTNGDINISLSPETICTDPEPSTVSWSNGDTGLTTTVNPTENTTYTVTMTDCNGCTATDEVTVTIIEPFISVMQMGEFTCDGTGTVQLIVSTNLEGTCTWTGPEGFTSTSKNPTVQVPGTYTVVFQEGGCTATTDVVVDAPGPCGDFDLALTKTLADGQDAFVNAGESANFTITVYNQGDFPANNITIVDYIPAELTLNDAEWDGNGAMAMYNVPGTLAPGESIEVDITFNIASGFSGEIMNFAEIKSADNANTGMPGEDIDSTPDMITDNDGTPIDNAITDPNDEDDHDPATIISGVFDLALIKVLAEGQSSTVNAGDDVTFTIEVHNQGDFTASQITIVDYVPAELTLNDNTWTMDGDMATYLYGGTIMPGGSIEVDITFTVAPTFDGSVTNFAEIKEATNDNTGQLGDDIDSTPDMNPGNDGTPVDNALMDNMDEDDHDPETITSNLELAGLGNFTWNDSNQNGLFDEGELPVEGILVQLFFATDTNKENPIDTVFTDENGYYEFINLDPNFDYVVQFAPFGPEGELVLTNQSGEASEGINNDSDANLADGCTDIIDLDPGEFDPTIDAGYYFLGSVPIDIEVILEGPAQDSLFQDDLDADLGGKAPEVYANWMMKDDLRSENLVPSNEPFSALPQFNHTGGEVAEPGAFDATGRDAIVDWILVQLRAANDPAQIVHSCAALLQRDGNIVGLDGVTTLQCDVDAGEYYISVKHRNHLGVMTASPVTLTPGIAPKIDFTNPETPTYGTHAQKNIDGSKMVLWAGNSDGNNNIIFQGNNTDINKTFFDVLTAPANTDYQINYLAPGYLDGDVDMNCQAVYQGTSNDPNNTFFNILTHPGNTSYSINYIIEEQLP